MPLNTCTFCNKQPSSLSLNFGNVTFMILALSRDLDIMQTDFFSITDHVDVSNMLFETYQKFFVARTRKVQVKHGVTFLMFALYNMNKRIASCTPSVTRANELPNDLREPQQIQTPSLSHLITHGSSSSSPFSLSPLSSSLTRLIFHSELKNWLFGKYFPPQTFFSPTGLIPRTLGPFNVFILLNDWICLHDVLD